MNNVEYIKYVIGERKDQRVFYNSTNHQIKFDWSKISQVSGLD